jgi:hypothetical protein
MKNYKYYVILLLPIIFLFLIHGGFFVAKVFKDIIFYIFVCYLLPYLYGDPKESGINKVFSGYPISLAVNLFVWILVLKFTVNVNIILTATVLTLIVWLVFVKDFFYTLGLPVKKRKIDNIPSLVGALILFFAILAVVYFLRVNNKLSELSFIYQDLFWTAGNTWSIVNWGIPLRDLRLSGVTFGYHVGQNILVAVETIFTNTDTLLIHTEITNVFLGFTSLCFVWFSLNNLFYQNKFLLWSTLVVLFFGMFNFGSHWNNSYLTHLFVHPVSFSFGFAFFVVVIIKTIEFTRPKHHLTKQNVLLLLSLVFLSVASKATLVFLLFPSLTVVFLYKLGFSQKAFLLILAFLIIVIFMKLTIYQSAINNKALELKIGLEYLNLKVFLWTLKKVIIFVLNGSYKYIVLFVFLKILSFGVINSFKLKDHLDLFFIVCFTFTVFLLDVFIRFQGGSRIYMFYYLNALSIFLIFYFISNINIKVSYINLFSLVLVLMFVSQGWIDFARSFNINPKNNVLSLDFNPDLRASLSSEERRAMEWINQNISKNVILVSDRFGFNHEISGEYISRWFGYSAISGRQFYVEGTNFLDKSNQIIGGNRQDSVRILLNTSNKTEFDKMFGSFPDNSILILSKRFWNYNLVNYYKELNILFENQDVVVVDK